jgi:hypothetical protein
MILLLNETYPLSKDIRKDRKLNIYNALIKSSLLYGSETRRLTEVNKRRVEGTEMDALRRSSRMSRKDKIRYVTIRQQIGLEETVIKEIEQNQLTWYGHVSSPRGSELFAFLPGNTRYSLDRREEKV